MKRYVVKAFKWLLVFDVLAVIGAFIAKQRIQPYGDEISDEFQRVALMDGVEFVCEAPALVSGSAIAGFGGVAIDLRKATLAPSGAHLKLRAVFGGIDVKVPEGWKVVSSGTGIFGGISNSARDDEPAGDRPTLTIEMLAMFGGVNVRSAPPVGEPIPAN